ncbi:MAG: hypothetical protein AMXMBFR34_47780 [Myxococcaceae bacterium]
MGAGATLCAFLNGEGGKVLIHLRSHVLEGRRAKYGGQIVSTASSQLAERHGRGFNEKSLRHSAGKGCPSWCAPASSCR